MRELKTPVGYTKYEPVQAEYTHVRIYSITPMYFELLGNESEVTIKWFQGIVDKNGEFSVTGVDEMLVPPEVAINFANKVPAGATNREEANKRLLAYLESNGKIGEEKSQEQF